MTFINGDTVYWSYSKNRKCARSGLALPSKEWPSSSAEQFDHLDGNRLAKLGERKYRDMDTKSKSFKSFSINAKTSPVKKKIIPFLIPLVLYGVYADASDQSSEFYGHGQHALGASAVAQQTKIGEGYHLYKYQDKWALNELSSQVSGRPFLAYINGYWVALVDWKKIDANIPENNRYVFLFISEYEVNLIGKPNFKNAFGEILSDVTRMQRIIENSKTGIGFAEVVIPIIAVEVAHWVHDEWPGAMAWWDNDSNDNWLSEIWGWVKDAVKADREIVDCEEEDCNTDDSSETSEPDPDEENWDVGCIVEGLWPPPPVDDPWGDGGTLGGYGFASINMGFFPNKERKHLTKLHTCLKASIAKAYKSIGNSEPSYSVAFDGKTFQFAPLMEKKEPLKAKGPPEVKEPLDMKEPSLREGPPDVKVPAPVKEGL